MGLGKNVAKLMKANGLNYGDVARGLKLDDRQAIWSLVKRDSKKSEFAGRLATFFGVPVDRLLAEDFEVDEKRVKQEAPAYRVRIASEFDQTNVENLLRLIRTFLNTDAEGKAELMASVDSLTVGGRRESEPEVQPRRAKR